MSTLRSYLALALLPIGLIVTAFLLYLLSGLVLAIGWLLFITVMLVGGRLLASEREEREREERELLELATQDCWSGLPERCAEAPDPYRRAA